jgi:hypothetical protein
MTDADTDTDELTTYQFIKMDDRGIDKLTTNQFMNINNRDTDELTTDQFMSAGKKIHVNLLQISSQIQIQCKMNLLTD